MFGERVVAAPDRQVPADGCEQIIKHEPGQGLIAAIAAQDQLCRIGAVPDDRQHTDAQRDPRPALPGE